MFRIVESSSDMISWVSWRMFVLGWRGGASPCVREGYQVHAVYHVEITEFGASGDILLHEALPIATA